jgi:hypothetical protein
MKAETDIISSISRESDRMSYDISNNVLSLVLVGSLIE